MPAVWHRLPGIEPEVSLKTVIAPARQQTKYQVRFDWGAEGLAAIVEGADVLIIADALSEPPGREADGSDLIPEGFDRPVLAATGGNSAATADWVLGMQEGKGDRFSVAVVAAGELGDEGGSRFCVEDLLVAGGIIDALAEVGIDYASPEASAAAATHQGLANAVSHIFSASVTGQLLLARGAESEIEAARRRLDVAHVVRLR